MRWRRNWTRTTVPSRRRAAVSLRLLLILVLGAVLVGSAWLFVPRPPVVPEAATAEPIATVLLDKYLVNLADTDEARYLQAELALEVTGLDELGGDGDDGGAHGGGEADGGMPIELKCRINDAVVDEVSSYTFSELATAGGKRKLKGMLRERIEECLAEEHEGAKVHHVLFVSFVMQ